MAALYFILDALLTLVVVAFLLRLLMPVVRADFRNLRGPGGEWSIRVESGVAFVSLVGLGLSAREAARETSRERELVAAGGAVDAQARDTASDDLTDAMNRIARFLAAYRGLHGGSARGQQPPAMSLVA